MAGKRRTINIACARTRGVAYVVRNNIAPRVLLGTVAPEFHDRLDAFVPPDQTKRHPPRRAQVIIAVAAPVIAAFNCNDILGTSK